jgi:hypothetical protein
MQTMETPRDGARTLLTTLAALSLAACATAPSHPSDQRAAALPSADGHPNTLSVQHSASAPLVGPVQLNVDSTVPAPDKPQSKLLAGNVHMGDGTGPVRYDASYSFDPGDVLARSADLTAKPALWRFGGQSLTQSVAFQMPQLAGAPISFRLSSALRDDWTVTGSTHDQNDLADLSWAPRGALLNLQWLDEQHALDPSLSLACDLRGSVQLPASAQSTGASRQLRFSGGYCHVLTPDSRYSDLAAQTWRVSHAWTRPEHESQVSLSMIDPISQENVDSLDPGPSYELGVRMSRSRGPWSAAAHAAVRGTDAIDVPATFDPMTSMSDARFRGTTDASLTRRLWDAALSASWAHGADPLWFVPQLGQSTNRFDLALDLSRWARVLLPDMTPKLGVSWNWWEARSPTGDVSGDNAVMLSISMTP